ncbi:MAG: carotenoid biosynthesis protein [Halobacteriales archaeon]
MDVQRRYARPTVALGAVALGHALLSWPAQRALALFVGGAAIAFAAEVVGVALGLLEHRLEPQVLGVPVVVAVGWPATVYVALRLALFVVPLGVGAAVLAAVLATLSDVVLDPRAVEDGAWRYPRVPVSANRYRDVPGWNFGAWFVASFVTALLPAFVA